MGRRKYREKLYKCGRFIEAHIYPVYEQQKGRGKKRKPTSEVQRKLNQKNAERKLTRLLNTNFTEEDLRFDLTYDPEHAPADAEEAQRHLQNFIRRVKRYRKAAGLEDLKYVSVTEQGSKSGRFHHHLVINGGISIQKLAAIWGKGYTTAKPLQFSEQGLAGLAKYLVKDPLQGKRWNASKNLKRPEEYQRDGRVSHRKAKEWALDYFAAREAIEAEFKGYQLTDIEPFYNDINGGVYIIALLYMPKKKGYRNAVRNKDLSELQPRYGT